MFSISKGETEPPPSPEPAAISPPTAGVTAVSPTPAPAPPRSRRPAINAKGRAPADSDIILYRRKSAWAVVIHYVDNLKAKEDLPKYRADRNWASAYVVNLGSWPPLA